MGDIIYFVNIMFWLILILFVIFFGLLNEVNKIELSKEIWKGIKKNKKIDKKEYKSFKFYKE